MGALPKRRTNHSKKMTRRSHDRAGFGAIGLCPHCRQPHLTHRACPHCGYYRGREVVVSRDERVAE